MSTMLLDEGLLEALRHKLPAEGVYAFRLLRWEADVPMTERQRASLMSIAPQAMALCGSCAAYPDPEGDALWILLAHTRFPARVHRDTAVWLCAHAFMEYAAVTVEEDGTMFIGEEMASDALAAGAMREISAWWTAVSPISGQAAHVHRQNLQVIIKRRQYSSLGGYVSRALRGTADLGGQCFGFVPLMMEAIWSQHAELSLRQATEGLDLPGMTRRPREALLQWLSALPPVLRSCPRPSGSEPIDRVIDSIRRDCSLPYSQANLSRSLGLTPAYFCRLFHEKTGQHFSGFLTRTRMEKAQELLSRPEGRTLAEISLSCGYPNKSYFCQVFKKYTGMTPGEFESAAQSV